MNDAESILLKELEKRNSNSKIVTRHLRDYTSDIEAISRGEYINLYQRG